MAAPGATRSWLDPTTVICLVGFLDLFGVSMVIPLIQNHAKELGASPSVAGLVGSVYGFLQLFSSPVIGKWSDLMGRRLVLMWCLVISGCGYVLLGMSTSLLFMALARIPSGLFKHSQTISKAYLAEVIPPEKRASAYGQFNAVSSIGFIVGPTVGGLLAESFTAGFTLVGLLAGLVFLISSALVSVIPLDSIKHPVIHPSKFIKLQEDSVSKFTNLQEDSVSKLTKLQEDSVSKLTKLQEDSVSKLTKLQEDSVSKFTKLQEDSVSKFTKLQEDSVTTAQEQSQARHFNFPQISRWCDNINWSEMWRVFLSRFFLGFSFLLLRTNYTRMLIENFHTSPTVNGYVISFSSIVGTISGFCVGKISRFYGGDDVKMISRMTILMFFAVCGLLTAPSLLVFTLFQAPLSLSSSVLRVAFLSLTVDRAGQSDMGGLVGLAQSLTAVSRTVAPFLSGLLLELTPRGPIWGSAVINLAGILTLIVFPISRKEKQKSS